MDFRTVVNIQHADFQIEPLEQLLFVGSCFADSIGKRFAEERFPVVVNPFGVMYNPVSVYHTLQRCESIPRIVFITLGTNHVYRLKETGEIVDNCQKKPQSLFSEEQLSQEQCVDILSQIIKFLQTHRPDVKVVFTVSPIRYAKYGFHNSQLSKAVLLLAVDKVVAGYDCATYFPAYEIVLDELRDYRFYQPDMLHPSSQAVEYIWQQFVDSFFSSRAKSFLKEWKHIKDALNHRPFNPESPEYLDFLAQTKAREKELLERMTMS